MISSMTGFATITATTVLGGEQTDIVITLKSFNGRFFEAQCKISHAFSVLEVAITRKLKTALIRGTVQCQIYARSSHTTLGSQIVPAWNTLDGYIAAEKEIATRYNLPRTLDIKTLLTLPHACDIVESTIAPQDHTPILELLDRALVILQEDRTREGNSLKKDLIERITSIATLFNQIPPRSEKLVTERRKELVCQMEKLLHNSPQETRDQQLVALDQQINRLDIHEEIARFSTHLSQLISIIEDRNHEKGKRLEFTLQELLREINTIAAKSPDTELTPTAINIKVELEKIREQVQNIL
jgi:uncharacterized protein (TIGR00255 family)